MMLNYFRHFGVVSRSQLVEHVKIVQCLTKTFCSTSLENKNTSSSSIEEEVKVSPPIKSKGGYAEAMAKFEGHESFTKMLRKSPLVQVLHNILLCDAYHFYVYI